MYSQVPAFSAADRAMIDVLTMTHEGRLAVVELKADEDIHLPLQGLDYWARVEWHHGRGEFLRFGYFGGRELSAETPLLFLVAPALHVHPATDCSCGIFRRRLSGRSWGLTSGGGRECGWCFGSEPDPGWVDGCPWQFEEIIHLSEDTQVRSVIGVGMLLAFARESLRSSPIRSASQLLLSFPGSQQVGDV